MPFGPGTTLNGIFTPCSILHLCEQGHKSFVYLSFAMVPLSLFVYSLKIFVLKEVTRAYSHMTHLKVFLVLEKRLFLYKYNMGTSTGI